MNTERFSMKEFKPLSYEERKIKMIEEIQSLENESDPIVIRKRELESQLTDINTRLKAGWMPDTDFTELSRIRQSIVTEKYTLDNKLREFNKKIKLLGIELEKLNMVHGRSEKSDIQKHLTEVRDRYTSFAADRTRVSSMRAMAAQFVEELNSAIKLVDK